MKSSILVIVTAVLTASCASRSVERSLQKVAKDWSMTVRASQVMPVYPLEEDIRPGDIYLHSNSIEEELQSWKKRGFLPLVNRYDRIPIPKDEYEVFYADSFSVDDPVSYSRAPRAAFPSYSFEVDKRGSLALAVPLNSVPVALAASGAQAATGNAVFSGAATQGLPDIVVEHYVEEWARRHAAELSRKARASSNPLTLRVITKVFTVEGATVSLAFSNAFGGRVQAGAPPAELALSGASDEDFDALIASLDEQIALIQLEDDEMEPIDLPPPAEAEDTDDPELLALIERRDKLLKLQANEQLAAAENLIGRRSAQDQFGGYLLPGMSSKVAGRSARGVTMEEEFERPLVLGYLATEYFVSRNGVAVPMGNIQDLIDDPSEFRAALKSAAIAAKDAVQTPFSPSRTDSGRREDNPFSQ